MHDVLHTRNRSLCLDKISYSPILAMPLSRLEYLPAYLTLVGVFRENQMVAVRHTDFWDQAAFYITTQGVVDDIVAVVTIGLLFVRSEWVGCHVM